MIVIVNVCMDCESKVAGLHAGRQMILFSISGRDDSVLKTGSGTLPSLYTTRTVTLPKS